MTKGIKHPFDVPHEYQALAYLASESAVVEQLHVLPKLLMHRQEWKKFVSVSRE